MGPTTKQKQTQKKENLRLFVYTVFKKEVQRKKIEKLY